jgi:ABC-type Zn uptake system ZnuABC Zn-binding protein ZnuA
MCGKKIGLCMALVLVSLLGMGVPQAAPAAGGPLDVLATTFPIYLFTRNVAKGREGVRVSLMIPAQLGCPHDYSLTPRDMEKLAHARVLVINGLGMEEFLGPPLQKANPQLTVIDSSQGIGGILHETDLEEGTSGGAGPGPSGHSPPVPENPHLFASPVMAARIADNIARGLSRVDPAGADLYEANARAYAEKMNRLAANFAALGKILQNNRIVTQHAVFDYLARDIGLKVVAVIQTHAGQAPSAAQMLHIIGVIKAEKAGALFTEPQYRGKIARTIARDAGIPTGILDPVSNGPENAPLDYYEAVMRKNLMTLRGTLGVR